MNNVYIAPSVLSADFTRLAPELESIKSADYIHYDVMDGHFVPNISFGPAIMKEAQKATRLPFDVHLMVEHPEAQVDSFSESGADWITFHHEASVHSNRLSAHIRSLGKKAGISIVPSTPVSAIYEMLEYVDIVLVMTVNPGFGGQSLIPSCVRKISALKEFREKNNLDFKISVDGGVNSFNIKDVVSAGADIIVSGSSFFSGELKLE